MDIEALAQILEIDPQTAKARLAPRIARLVGWRRTFNAEVAEAKGPRLNLVPDRHGEVVGVLYRSLEDKDLDRIDRAHSDYLRRALTVADAGADLTAEVYLARRRRKGDPEREYEYRVLGLANGLGPEPRENFFRHTRRADGKPRYIV